MSLSGRMTMVKKTNVQNAATYVVGAAAAIAISYFILGGSTWSPALWAIFAVLAIWIVVMNVRRDAGLESEETYVGWELLVAFLLVLSVIVASMWHNSIWLFVLGVVLGVVWLGDLRVYRSMRRQSRTEGKKDGADSDL